MAEFNLGKVVGEKGDTGQNGKDGANGADGSNGNNGASVWVKYNTLPQDEGASDIWADGMDYIGVQTLASDTKPTTGYMWAVFVKGGTPYDGLDSTEVSVPLSANMGRVLNEKIEEMTVITDLFVQFECEGTMGEGTLDVFGYGEFKLEQVPMHTRIRSENDLVKLYGNARVELDHGIEMMGGGILGDIFKVETLVLDNGVLYIMIPSGNAYGDIFTIPDVNDPIAFTFVGTTPTKQYPNLWTNTQKFREPITDVDVIEKYKQAFADVCKNK